MKVFYVSYDVREEDKVKNLRNRLIKLKGKRVLESVWTVKLPDKYTYKNLLNNLRKYIDENTGLIVVEANNHHWINTDDEPHEID
jgi:CRISPR/Cas system-associated endoribonuclease Cas2